MRRADRFIRITMALATGFSWITSAAASHPDLIRSYRLIPGKSSLQQTGGFAGVHLDYLLRGHFDLVTGFEEGASCLAIGCPPPTHIPFARFERVAVNAFVDHPTVDAAPIPLERFIDLEQLRGTFRLGEPQRLLFAGQDHQGEPFQLLAVQRGPLLHLVGESREQCCDFFHYKLEALAYLAPYADFNLDGLVDRHDLDRLLGNFGRMANASFDSGDADGDGDVDGDDFFVWQRQVGMALDMSQFADDALADLGPSAAATPEPAATLLALSSIILLLCLRRRPKLR